MIQKTRIRWNRSIILVILLLLLIPLVYGEVTDPSVKGTEPGDPGGAPDQGQDFGVNLTGTEEKGLIAAANLTGMEEQKLTGDPAVNLSGPEEQGLVEEFEANLTGTVEQGIIKEPANLTGTEEQNLIGDPAAKFTGTERQGIGDNIVNISENEEQALIGDPPVNLTGTVEQNLIADPAINVTETGEEGLSIADRTGQENTTTSCGNHSVVIVLNDPGKWSSIENVTGMVCLNITLLNETDAACHDFGPHPFILAASVGNATLERINATADGNATLVVCDPSPGLSFEPCVDPAISRYWSEGGDEQVLEMLRYIGEQYFGNSAPNGTPPPPETHLPSIVMIIGGESYVPMYTEAAKESQAQVTVYPASALPPDLNLTGYDLVFMEMFGAGIDVIGPAVQEAAGRGIPIAVIHGGEYEYMGTVDMAEHPAVEEYWQNSGPENARRLINYLCAAFCGSEIEVQDPIFTPAEGIYHPDADRLFEDLDEYLAWYAENGTYDPSRPTIGVVFYDTDYKSGDLRGDHAIFRGLESAGANIIPVYLYYDQPDVIDRFFTKDGVPVVDAIINIRSFRFYGRTPDRGVERLQAYNIPIINAHTDYYLSPEEWAGSTEGIPASSIGTSIALPELDGQTDFIWTAGRAAEEGSGLPGYRPITPVDSQVQWLADRALALARLKLTANADKKVAIIYYNHGGGKNNLGATYLDIVPSLTNLLSAMKAEGYQVQGEVPDEDTLLDLMLLEGRNVGTWAPGELTRMVEEGDVTLIPAGQYLEWFHELPADRQQEVIDTWGEPPGEIMVCTRSGQQYLVIPKISFGNVILTPQPTRGWLQDAALLYHDKSLPPHHQYIAFYFWLREEFGADAVIHFGTHGTQEWLPGKERGLSADDWPALLIGECPNIYPYIMDNLGEGTQAKRRGNAVIVDHLTPPIISAGLYGDLLVLHEKIHAYGTVNGTLREEYMKSITAIYRDMGLPAALGVSAEELEGMPEDEFTAFVTGDLHTYLHALGDEQIPYGLHILGQPPEGDKMVSLVRTMLGTAYENDVAAVYPDPHELSAAHGNCTVLHELLARVLIDGATPAAAQQAVLGAVTPEITADLETALRYQRDIGACTIEIPRILNALSGGYTPPRSGGDPVRNPEGLPTGNNFYSFDSRTMPTKEAWNVGVQMAEEMIARYQAEHDGAYPEKTAFVLWAYESMLHEGAMESEALYLMGVRPVWSSGKVIDVELIPSAELGRPRLDVLFTASGLYRDTFADKIVLLDKAVRLAAQADRDLYPDYVRQDSEALYEALRSSGCDEETARSLSMARVFSEAAGAYGTGLSEAIGASNTWEDEQKLADLYVSRVGNVYGADGWGEQNQDLFRLNLASVDAAVHSRSSNLVGLVDNDDCFQYFGALSLAVRSIAGTEPEMYISDLRTADAPRTTTLSEYMTTELNARYFNPTWIEGMMEHGYAGARYMDTQFTENLWGWTVTNPDLITGEVWDRVYQVYVNDQYDLGLDAFFEENPYAYQSMVARMTETARKDYWQPDQAVLDKLAHEYEQSVQAAGVTCCHHTCGNLALDEYRQQLLTVINQVTPAPTQAGSGGSGGGSGGGGGGFSAGPAGGVTGAPGEGSPGANDKDATNTSAPAGYGTDPGLIPAAADSAVRTVQGAVMKVVSPGASSPGSSSTPLIPVVIVVVLIGAVMMGFFSRRK
jgi:cobaltochelatase CobN